MPGDASTSHRIYIQMVKTVLDVYFRFYHHLRVEGAEYIPKGGPVFLTINHVSFLEPFACGVALVNRGLIPGADMWVVAKKELFAVAPLGWFLKSIGMFPIDREHIDLGAMRMMLNLLRDKKMIAIAPEGTRSPTGQLQAFQPVVAKIAVSHRVPILPVAAEGSERALPVGSKFPRPYPVTLHFGPVYELSEFYGLAMSDEQADRASWVMRRHVAELLPEALRQVPAPSQRVGARKM